RLWRRQEAKQCGSARRRGTGESRSRRRDSTPLRLRGPDHASGTRKLCSRKRKGKWGASHAPETNLPTLDREPNLRGDPGWDKRLVRTRENVARGEAGCDNGAGRERRVLKGERVRHGRPDRYRHAVERQRATEQAAPRATRRRAPERTTGRIRDRHGQRTGQGRVRTPVVPHL